MMLFLLFVLVFFFFKQKTAYEMRISDWSSDVCSSDLLRPEVLRQPIWKGWTCPCRAIPKAARPAPAVRGRGGACCEAAPAFAYRFRSIAPAEAPGNRPPPRASLRATDRRDGQADRHRPPPEARSAPARRRCGKAEGQCRSCSQRIRFRSTVSLASFPRR